MPASPQGTAQEQCGTWMPKARAYCARPPHEGSNHMSPANMAARRACKKLHPTPQTPEAKKKSARKSRIAAYGITVEQFSQLLEIQGYACAMYREPFDDEQIDGEQPIHIDHNHNHCRTKNRSCGQCVRGLLCSRSSFEPNPPGPRRPPMASISSMKMIDGARLRASANR